MRLFLTMLVAVGALLAARPAHALEWAEVRTQHFIIYGKASDKELPKLALRLEMVNRMLATLLNYKEDDGQRPLLVYVVSEGEVKENAGQSTAAGFYASERRNGYALVKRGRSYDMFDLGQEAILFHEFAHHFMLGRSASAYPAWYVEGFAEFFSTLEFKDDNSIVFGKVPLYRAPQLVMTDLYPLHKLLHETSNGLSLAEGDRYYGAAWLLTHYLFLNAERNKEFQAYITDLASPGGARDVGSYFKGGEKGLETDLKAYLKARLKAYSYPVPMEGIAPPVIRRLPPDENALLLQELRFKRPMSSDDAKALAKEVQGIAAGYPNSAHAQAFLAEVLADGDDWQGADAAADTAIRLDPSNARAFAARAESIWGRAREAAGEIPYKAILQAISSANRADLEDPYPLYLYYLVQRSRGPVPEVAVDALYKVFRQLPQREEYRWAYAGLLADRKEYQNAINVITPLANDPHGGGGTAAAQRRRDVLIAQRDGKPVPAEDAGESDSGKGDGDKGK